MSDKYGYIGIETLLNFCSNDKNHCVTPNDFMRMNRIKIDERPHGEWIPCSERLPDMNKKVLCACIANIYEVLELRAIGWFYDNAHIYMKGFVLAWMPLPEPYKEEGDKE